jgi:hypothetical protein
MTRNIMAAVGGVVVTFVIILLVRAVGYIFFPPMIQMDVVIIPPKMFAVLFVGNAIGSFVAGYLIGRVSESNSMPIAALVGSVFTVLWIVNLIAQPLPLWVAVTGCFTFIPFAAAGARISGSPGPVPEEEDVAVISEEE